jgi:hypothetical protein
MSSTSFSISNVQPKVHHSFRSSLSSPSSPPSTAK